jgi:hypothetical protein
MLRCAAHAVAPASGVQAIGRRFWVIGAFTLYTGIEALATLRTTIT